MAKAYQTRAAMRLRSVVNSVVNAARDSDRIAPSVRIGREGEHDRWFRYGTLIPAVIILLALTVYPTINLIMMSLSTIDFAQDGQVWRFTPFANFERLFSDRLFAITLKNTLILDRKSVV